MKRSYLIVILAGFLLGACESALMPEVVPPTTTVRPTATQVATETPVLQATVESETPATVTATLEPPAFIPTLVRLTDPGCCVQPLWSADGQQVRIIDKQAGLPTSAIYGIDISTGETEVVSRVIGLYSPGDLYMAYLNEEFTSVVQNQETGIRTIIPSEGQRIIFSPGNKRVAWQIVRQIGIFGERRSEISVSIIDGRNATQVVAATGGSIVGWVDDDHLLLLAGMPNKDANYRALFSIALEDEDRTDLIDNDRIVHAGIAPGGEWVWYAIAFSPEDAANNGLWIVRSDGSDRHQLEVFGAPQWRDGSHLLIVPEESIGDSHYLLQLDAETRETTRLTDPDTFPFKIQAGEWKVSPTGEHIVFLNAADSALWIFDLPPIGGP